MNRLTLFFQRPAGGPGQERFYFRYDRHRNFLRRLRTNVQAHRAVDGRQLLIALEGLPQTRARLKALVRVGDRRWNLQLTSGTTIALPEEDAPQALAQLETLLPHTFR